MHRSHHAFFVVIEGPDLRSASPPRHRPRRNWMHEPSSMTFAGMPEAGAIIGGVEDST